MARYINAEKCPCKGCGITYCNENCKKYYAWLNGCDYDVEAKVAELKENALTKFDWSEEIDLEEAISIIR